MKINWSFLLPVALAYLIFAILLNSVGVVILQSIHSFNVSKQSASVLEGFKDLPIALVSLFLASFLPRLGYKKSLQAGIFLVLISCIAMPLLPGFLTVKILFLTLGACFAVVKISVYSLVGAVTQNPQQHASLLNMIEGIFMTGVLAGNWLFSYFMQNDGGNYEWLQVYWILAALCLIDIFLLKIIQLPTMALPRYQTIWAELKPMTRLFSQTIVMVFIISAFTYVLIEQSLGTWLPTFNYEILQLTPKMSVQAASFFAGSLALGRLAASVLLQKIHWRKLLSFCIAAACVMLFVMLSSTRITTVESRLTWQTMPVGVLLLPAIGFFMAPIYPALNSVILSSLPRSQHAAMTGIIVIFSAVGGTLGSLITGNLFSLVGGIHAFYALLLPLALLYLATLHLGVRTKAL
ncbi:MFS transporter [Legionella londiniensis]|uniref:Putative transporter n=1 Tax=Legionella londiniensis TaxID=45068 RepID=A0A0W0VNS6_9GAMM|nr:MFS transporter [Legionella londiniensis]KTD21742.1 putative transporter [Legionella londiniensis]STX93421.1 putative transporter [Legionella londiniensis]